MLQRTRVILLGSCFLAAATWALSAAQPAGKEPEAVRIWPGGAPRSDAAHWPRPDYHEEWQTPGEILAGVTEPTVQAYLPDSTINTGAAVVICPGGGYQNLWINKEGWKVARELQKRGIAGIVLKYRYYDRFAAVEDAQRAVRYVRSRAREWHVNEHAVGVGGFSAGGHLSLHMAAQVGRAEDWRSDEIDKLSRRPDFVMAIYPSVYLPDKGAVVDGAFPPTFIASAADDDKMRPRDITAFFLKLQDLQVRSELHIYRGGGHGFGTGTAECNCASWLDLFRNWLQAGGFLRTPPQS